MRQSSGNTIVDRAMRVIQLDQPVYTTIARDPNATQQAAIVVGVVALASAIGGATEGLGGIIAGLLSAILGWLIFSGLAWFFGTNIFGTPTTAVSFESLLRTLGYARAPGVLAVFGFIPLIGWLAVLAGALLSIVTAVLAIRETLRFSTGRAIITAIIAWIAWLLVAGIIGLLFGVGAGF